MNEELAGRRVQVVTDGMWEGHLGTIIGDHARPGDAVELWSDGRPTSGDEVDVQLDGIYGVRVFQLHELAHVGEWWLCPLRQCPHGAVLHDGDGTSEDFTCCVYDCGCKGYYEWAT